MEKEFIQYNQALALKELGFDEPCIKEYHLEELLSNSTGDEVKNSELIELYGESGVIAAPLYSQVFRWFREEYTLHLSIVKMSFAYIVPVHDLGNFKTYEEAELECLKKLIEIVKSK